MHRCPFMYIFALILTGWKQISDLKKKTSEQKKECVAQKRTMLCEGLLTIF